MDLGHRYIAIAGALGELLRMQIKVLIRIPCHLNCKWHAYAQRTRTREHMAMHVDIYVYIRYICHYGLPAAVDRSAILWP